MTERRIGVARVLSKLGYCSRSQAFELVRGGRVAINGRVTRNPEAPILESKDRISVDGRQVSTAGKLYLMVNKPRGIVTTAADEKGRQTVYSLLPPEVPWLAPVGRLDKASEGLLLLTNDSQWGARITAPESHLDKTYHVQIATVADASLLQALQSGVTSDGETLRAKSASILRTGDKTSWLEIVLDEGRNRQIRRMLQSQRVDVLRLIRVAIGPLQLGNLPKGQVRKLTQAEKLSLDALFPPKAALRRG